MPFFRKIAEFLGWSASGKPDIKFDSKFYEELKIFRLPFILIVLLMMIGTIGYIIFSNFSFVDAFYQAGMTFTTVGFTEVGKITPAGRIFTIVFIIFGFLAFTFSLGLVVEALKNGHLFSLLRERSMIYEIARLKHHFIICYHNLYTIELAKQFRENHVPFVVIDPRDDLAQIAKEQKYPYFIVGEPHTEINLLKAHIASAKGIITLSTNAADNIAIVATVRLYERDIERKKPYFIITSSENEADTQKLKKLGADSVISPSKIAAQRLSAISVRPDMENILDKFLYQKDSLIDIEEIKIPDFSWTRFKRIGELHLDEISNSKIIGIRDENNKFIPMPGADIIIGSGARLLLVGTADGIRTTKRLIYKKYKPQEVKYV